MPDLLPVPSPAVMSAPPARSGGRPKPGATVVGADGARLGMVSALVPDPVAPTHLLVFVAERRQLIPREYPLPMAAVVRLDDAGVVHVAVTGDALRGGEEARSRGGEE